MVRVDCNNSGCRLHRRGACTADTMTIVMDDDGYMKALCPEIMVED